MPRSVICISQTTGSGGPEIARIVSEQLDFRYVDEEIVRLAAEREKVDPQEIGAVERQQTLVNLLLEAIERREKFETFGRSAMFPDPEAERPLGALPVATSEAHRAAIRAVIREVAEAGNVVIVSHGASFALAALPGLLRVLVTASPETRARRITAAGDDERKLLRTVRKTDRSRADYLKRFYGVSREDPTHYDLVVNSDVLGNEQAAELIVTAARQ